MKTWWSIFGVFVVCTTLFVGVVPTVAADVTEITLAMGVPVANMNVVESIIASFEETYPYIHVNLEATNSKKTMVMIAGGVIPDVATINNAEIPDFFKKGGAMDLTPFIERDNFDTSILPPTKESLMFNNTWFGMPQAGGAFADRAIFYNRDLFSAAGLTYPTAAWDWDTFKGMATKLTQDTNGDGAFDQTGYSFTNLEWPIYIWSNGGEIFDEARTKFTLTEPSAVQALDWWAEMTMAGTAKTAPALNFGAGNVGMNTGAYFQAQNLADTNPGFEWAIVEFPQGRAGSVNRRVTHPFFIPTGAKHPEEAWLFIKYWLSNEIQRKLVLEWRWRPPQTRPIAQLMAGMKLDKSPFSYAAFMGLSGSTRGLPLDVPNWSEILGVINSAVVQVWNGAMPARAAMESIAPQVEALMSEKN